MGNRTVVHAALLGVVSLPVLPVLAQEIDAVRMSFGITQGFEYGDNLELDDPSEGESSIATTTLSFGIVAETERQQLDFGISGALQIQNTPNTDGTEADFANPSVDLSYNLDGEDSPSPERFQSLGVRGCVDRAVHGFAGDVEPGVGETHAAALGAVFGATG